MRNVHVRFGAHQDGDSDHEMPFTMSDLAYCYWREGAYDEARVAYTEARDRTDDVRAWRGIASTLRRQGRYDDALATLDKAFASADRSADVRSLMMWNVLYPPAENP